MDAVSDRDFVVEFISACTLLMTHLSRLSQELINWSMPEFDFVTLDDAYTTGSSIMPQKKNPDVCELIRGRSARLLGNLTAIFALLKALPLAYNRDLQDDKPLLFESFDLTLPSVRLIKAMLETAAFHPSKMASATRGDYSTATDLADYLVRKGSTFREAHELVGRIVRDCIEKKRGLERLTLKELQTFSPLLDEGVLSLLKPITSMSSRTTEGGTAPSSVTAQIRQAKKALKISK
jgi:argininosuccinate lyase